MTIGGRCCFRLHRAGRLLMVVALLGALVPDAAFGDSQSRASSPQPDASPTPSPRKTLSEYARGRQLQSASSGRTESVLITDENLEGLASGVELTSVAGSIASEPVAKAPPDTPRNLWRGRIMEKQETIQILEVENARVDKEISGLWALFYACDEPENREKNIRPRLNQQLVDRARLREELKTAHSDFKELLVDARRSGALPGWFRDLLK
ncbi:MAG: hypothetical protein DRJ65_03610 [Acidobacteria bacterium]|nr:MAG: hypothetical protein DRJ65_03610 [Acidobacteriota bacterium]